MLVQKLKATLVALMAVAVSGAVTAMLLGQVGTAEPGNARQRGLAPAQPPAAASAKADADEPARKDQQRLQGTWEPFGENWSGLAKEFDRSTLVVAGNRITVNPGDKPHGWSYTLRPGRVPSEIDLTPLDGPNKGKVLPGIYSLDGDYVEICVNDRPGGRRPRAFVTTPDVGGSRLFVLKRDGAEDTPSMDESRYRLKNIGLAMHAYRKDHGRFPPAAIYSKDGKPLLSWRVILLPYIALNNLFKYANQELPWDDPANLTLRTTPPKMYQAAVPVNGEDEFKSFYQVFVGPGTVFEGKEGVRLADITGGLSGTILVAEAEDLVPWPAPAELPYTPGKRLPKLGGQFKDGFHVLMADGSVHFIPRRFNEQVLRLAITRDGGKRFRWSDLGR